MGRSLLRMREVMARTGRSRSQVYRDIERGLLPPPVRLGRKFSVWPSDEIDRFVEEQIANNPRGRGHRAPKPEIRVDE